MSERYGDRDVTEDTGLLVDAIRDLDEQLSALRGLFEDFAWMYARVNGYGSDWLDQRERSNDAA